MRLEDIARENGYGAEFAEQCFSSLFPFFDGDKNGDIEGFRLELLLKNMRVRSKYGRGFSKRAGAPKPAGRKNRDPYGGKLPYWFE
jgi:hypothetical protein